MYLCLLSQNPNKVVSFVPIQGGIVGHLYIRDILGFFFLIFQQYFAFIFPNCFEL